MGSDEEILDNTLISKARLEALVDGVFAFAMTLLVVSLNVPTIPKAEAATELPAYLVTMFPQFLSFLIAFFILASLWIVHHEHFHFLRSVNKVVLWLNILILIFVGLVPFSTNLSGAYSHVPIAPLIFHANMLILSCLFLVQWQCTLSTDQHSLPGRCTLIVLWMQSWIGFRSSLPLSPEWRLSFSMHRSLPCICT